MSDIVQIVGASGAFAGFGLVFVLLIRYIGWIQKDRDFWREAALKSTTLAETSSEVSAVMVGATKPGDEAVDPLADQRIQRLETVVDLLLSRGKEG